METLFNSHREELIGKFGGKFIDIEYIPAHQVVRIFVLGPRHSDKYPEEEDDFNCFFQFCTSTS
jgi:hypothetical protein